MRRLWLPVSYIGMAFRTRSDSLILGQAAPPATIALEGGLGARPGRRDHRGSDHRARPRTRAHGGG